MSMKACCTSLELQHAANYLVKLPSDGNRERGIHHLGAACRSVDNIRWSTPGYQEKKYPKMLDWSFTMDGKYITEIHFG
jgi:hypothetical protein